MRKYAYRKAFFRLGLPAIAVASALQLVLIATVVVPETKRLLVPPPPVIVKTFDVHCLEPGQIAELLRPCLPIPQNPRWQAERFDVFAASPGASAVTVRAPKKLIDRVPLLIEEFEARFGTSCAKL